MSAIESPLIVIASLEDGKKRVVREVESGTSTLAQLQQVLRGQWRQLEIIDAGGNYWPRVAGQRGAAAWQVYLQGGPFGVLGFVFDLLFLTVLVRVNFAFDTPPERLSLSEVKKKVCDAIRTNPDFYTGAPPEELLGRVQRAKSVLALIKRIGED